MSLSKEKHRWKLFVEFITSVRLALTVTVPLNTVPDVSGITYRCAYLPGYEVYSVYQRLIYTESIYIQEEVEIST